MKRYINESLTSEQISSIEWQLNDLFYRSGGPNAYDDDDERDETYVAAQSEVGLILNTMRVRYYFDWDLQKYVVPRS